MSPRRAQVVATHMLPVMLLGMAAGACAPGDEQERRAPSTDVALGLTPPSPTTPSSGAPGPNPGMPTPVSRPDAAPRRPLDPGFSCLGSLYQYTRATLGSMTDPGYLCSETVDLDIVCSNDMVARTNVCRDRCLTRRDPRACVSVCLTEELALSRSCLSCYSNLAGCTIDACLGECRHAEADPARCLSCQEASCLPQFRACTGYGAGPIPVIPPGQDAGAHPDAGDLDASGSH